MDEANALFDRDIKRFVAIVNRDVGNIVNQNQFDALVSFCYNEGNLWDLPSKIKAGTLTQNDWCKYKMAGGKPILLSRRLKEWSYYQSGKLTGEVGYNIVQLTQSNDAQNKDMNDTFLSQLLNDSRLKSLLWRAGAMGLAFLVNASINNLTALHMNSDVTVFVGLVLGEVSKALNNYLHQETTLG